MGQIELCPEEGFSYKESDPIELVNLHLKEIKAPSSFVFFDGLRMPKKKKDRLIGLLARI
jgi:hypothetical protein